MAVVPIGTYFATLKYFTKGEHSISLFLVPAVVMDEKRMIRLLVLS